MAKGRYCGALRWLLVSLFHLYTNMFAGFPVNARRDGPRFGRNGRHYRVKSSFEGRPTTGNELMKCFASLMKYKLLRY